MAQVFADLACPLPICLVGTTAIAILLETYRALGVVKSQIASGQTIDQRCSCTSELSEIMIHVRRSDRLGFNLRSAPDRQYR